MTYHAVIVGAGVAGCTLARLLAEKGQTVLLLEQRPHIAGQAYDEKDEHGILVHRYGPHLFHTDNRRTVEFLSRFTGWHPYEHHVMALIQGRLVPVPFNFDSLESLFPTDEALRLEELLTRAYGEEARISIWELLSAEEEKLRELGGYIYENLFYHYTAKQWGREPGVLSPDVLSRVPVVVGRDGRYFTDPFQAMPDEGYTPLFTRMTTHAGISLEKKTSWKERLSFSQGKISLDRKPYTGAVCFTAPLDELFDFCYGELPYRSLSFTFSHCHRDRFQPVCTVNYPNEEAYTRITEFKHCTGQEAPGTTVAYEYPRPCSLSKGDIPYYPVPGEESAGLYEKYAALARSYKGLFPVGRLAEYKYYNMAQAMDAAFAIAEKITMS
jgi:UDP-galactopyranose mutase